jgi:hypothetical protein
METDKHELSIMCAMYLYKSRPVKFLAIISVSCIVQRIVTQFGKRVLIDGYIYLTHLLTTILRVPTKSPRDPEYNSVHVACYQGIFCTIMHV